MNDYIGAAFAKPEDKVDYGVRGMKWGVRRPRSVLRAAAKKKETTSKPADKDDNPGIKAATGEETSAARYSRLAAQAKAGKGSELSDADLKFFNARTEALAKVNKLNETKPGWLAETSKSVLQTTAKNQMQAVADSLANKYIGGPIKESIGTHVTKEAAAAAAKKLAEEAAKKA